MILNKNIQVDNVITQIASTGNTKYTIISGKDKYSFYQSTKDGEDSDVYGSYKNMNVRLGDVVAIGYIEEPATFTNAQGKVINYKKRSIVNLREAGHGDIPVQKPFTEPKVAKKEPQTDWDEIAVGKCQTAFLSAYISSGKTISEAKLQVVATRQLAELVVYGTQQTTETTTEPVQNDPIDVEDIPF